MKRYDVLLSCITLSLLTNVWTVSAEVITRDKYTVVYSNPGKETSYTYDATKENKPLNFLVISALGGTNNITIKGKLGDSNGPSSTFDTNTSVAELREGDYRFTLDSEKNNAPPSSIMISMVVLLERIILYLRMLPLTIIPCHLGFRQWIK